MYANGLTKYNSLSGYRPQDPVLREESAKIIAQAYRILGYPQESKNSQCSFSDEKNFDSSLSSFIADSCKWGIFKGANGQFLPHKTPRWTMYFVKAKAIGLTKEANVNSLDRPTSREELALLIYRFKNLILNKDQNSSAKSQLNNVNQNPSSFLQNYLTGSTNTGSTTDKNSTSTNPLLNLLSGGNESSSSLSILNNPEITEAMHRMKEA